MRNGISMALVAAIATIMMVAAVRGQTTQPFSLAVLPPESESVYAPPAPPREDEGVNMGAVHFDLAFAYFTDYVYRGIEIFEAPGGEDRINLQIYSKLSFDLGKFPHPFLGVFVNFSDSDPISTFQEIRPTLGAEWTLRPVVLSAGYTSYLYPDRDEFETSEVWGKIQIDDSYFLGGDKPFLSPYIYAAYDYDRYNGWYFEAGVSHDFVIEDTGLTLTVDGHVGYVQGIDLYATVPNQKHVNGFQHYQVGLIANYSINTLLNFPQRYGEWSLQGFVYYTDGIDHDLRSNTQVWGGAGIMFKY